MGNQYLKMRADRDRDFFEAGMRTGAQLVVDFISQTLHDPAVMGKTRVLKRDSIERILGNCKVLDEHFSIAFSDHVEADYIRAEWDGVMREIYGDDADSFEKRYPYAKTIQYIKSRKGWT